MNEAPSATSPKAKRWPLALLIGLLTAIAGATLAIPVSDSVMAAHHVSTMEGGRACAVVGIWMPLAFLVGFVIGFLVGLKMNRVGFAGYALKQGISLAAIAALVLAVGGLAYAAADHPPLIDGQPLALEIEVRVPAAGRSVEQLKATGFNVALVVSASDRAYSDLRWSDATRTEEFITVLAWAPLNSRNAAREITAGETDEDRQAFPVMLRASPKKVDDNWSAWVPPRVQANARRPAPEEQQYLIRYRVRLVSEYSPTPTPSEPATTPEQQPTPEGPAAE